VEKSKGDESTRRVKSREGAEMTGNKRKKKRRN